MKKKFNRLVDVEVDEISAVDRPAQPGARALIFKRETPIAPEQPSAVPSGESQEKPEESTMTPEQIAALQAELAVAKAFGELSDAEKSLWKSLDEAGRTSFLKLAPAERKARVDAAVSADPIVYTDARGRTFRKSHDPMLVELAKQADEDRAALLAERAERQKDALEKRASTEIQHLTGSVPAKVRLLKAVDSLPAGAERDEVAAILKAANSAMALTKNEKGTSEGASGESAEDQLEKLARDHAKAHNIDLSKAYTAVMATDEGKKLYAEAYAQNAG